jgi:hypothetical protein
MARLESIRGGKPGKPGSMTKGTPPRPPRAPKPPKPVKPPSVIKKPAARAKADSDRDDERVESRS